MVHRCCPKCGGQLSMDKLTSSGREIRDYDCLACGWGESEDCGPAMWTMMSANSNDSDSDCTNEKQQDQNS